MAIGIRTPGAQLLFVRFRSNPPTVPATGTAQYLGTCIAHPDFDEDDAVIPIMNDLGGRSKPFQEVQDGNSARVTCVLNRYDYDVVQAVRSLTSGAPPGTSTSGIGGSLGSELGPGRALPSGIATPARGTLLIGGLGDFELIYVNAYAGTLSAGQFVGAADLEFGRRYLSAKMLAYKEGTPNRAKEVAFVFDCQNVFSSQTQGFSLYFEADDTTGIGPLGPLGPIS